MVVLHLFQKKLVTINVFISVVNISVAVPNGKKIGLSFVFLSSEKLTKLC